MFCCPFVRVAAATEFPRGVPWLWVGPSGPHIIGKVVRELARRTGSIDPFSVDFDPRCAKKLQCRDPARRRRYLDHVTAQAIEVLRRGRHRRAVHHAPCCSANWLSMRMTDGERESIRGIHYGGRELSTRAAVNDFREQFPNAVHLAGYGNTLLGVVMEVTDGHRMAMDYFPLERPARVRDRTRHARHGPPLPVEYGERGRVMFHRLDESVPGEHGRTATRRSASRPYLKRMPLKHRGRRTARNPRPPVSLSGKLQHGLY